MSSRFRVGVMGAGSIGCFLGARLALSEAVDLAFVGRERVGAELSTHGLTVRDFGRPSARLPPGRIDFRTDVASLADCQVILCCVKSAQTEAIAMSLAETIPADAIVVSMQNGVHNAETLRSRLGHDRVLSAIVDFNVVWQAEGLFQRTTSGPLVVETCAHPAWQTTVQAFRSSGLELEEERDILPAQWTKLLVNLNNAISALSGAPTRDLLLVPAYRRAVAAVVDEGLRVLRKAGIQPAKLRGVPIAWMPKILALPTPIVRLVTSAQMKIDPEARSSMWQDLQQHRRTEVDYLNGEIVALAERTGGIAPINRRVVALIREAEQAGQGSPGLSGTELWAALQSPARDQ